MILSLVSLNKARRKQAAPYPPLRVLIRQKPGVVSVDHSCINAFKSFQPFLGHCDFLQCLETKGVGLCLSILHHLGKKLPSGLLVSQVNTQA